MTQKMNQECALTPFFERAILGVCALVVVVVVSQLTAHQHQKGHTVPKQVIMIATSIQVATV